VSGATSRRESLQTAYQSPLRAVAHRFA
jgi:hypothetical protein